MHGSCKRWINLHICSAASSVLAGVALSSRGVVYVTAIGLQCMQLSRCDADVKPVASCLGCSPSVLVAAISLAA
jgi:hypothetical protein